MTDHANGWRDISTAPKDGIFLVCGGIWRSDLSKGFEDDERISLVEADEDGEGKFFETGGDGYASWIEKPRLWKPVEKPPT